MPDILLLLLERKSSTTKRKNTSNVGSFLSIFAFVWPHFVHKFVLPKDKIVKNTECNCNGLFFWGGIEKTFWWINNKENEEMIKHFITSNLSQCDFFWKIEQKNTKQIFLRCF